MTEEERLLEHTVRYQKACHAMQSGVAMEMQIGGRAHEPKHLRVGVNSAMVEGSALVQLLIEKGLFTKEEWARALAVSMENEVRSYEARLSQSLGGQKITLL